MQHVFERAEADRNSTAAEVARQRLALYQAGKLNLDDMLTREYSLEQINDGYRDMLDGRNIRGVIRYTDADR